MTAGQQAVIGQIEVPETLAERLTALGISEGTTVKCLGAGPLGDPVAYEVRRTVIALRRADCMGIEVC
ncbi:ferrous iron transport protein A [Butyricicoccus pullicaecorum]|uniref:FeoA family protein n=1 Tax=Butyricicoccus pullicaecorum TaxID=501571 RepID=UPI003520C3FC